MMFGLYYSNFECKNKRAQISFEMSLRLEYFIKTITRIEAIYYNLKFLKILASSPKYQ